MPTPQRNLMAQNDRNLTLKNFASKTDERETDLVMSKVDFPVRPKPMPREGSQVERFFRNLRSSVADAESSQGNGARLSDDVPVLPVKVLCDRGEYREVASQNRAA